MLSHRIPRLDETELIFVDLGLTCQTGAENRIEIFYDLSRANLARDFL